MNRFRPGRLRPGLVLALVTLVSCLAFAPGSARADAGSLPFGMSWQTVPWQPCGTTDVAVKFVLCECQVDLLGAEVATSGRIVVHLRARPDIVCVNCVPDSVTVDLGTHSPGHYSRLVEFQVEYVSPPTDSTWIPSGHTERIEYSVQLSCSNPGGVPYLDRVIIGSPSPCLECPPRVCPDDSIDVHLAGLFPNDCTWLGGVSLEPSPLAGPLPAPPTIRLHYETASCLGRPCSALAQPWEAHVRLPGLPFRRNDFYALPVEAWLRDICDTADSLGQNVGSQAFAFFVAESCSTTTPPPPNSCFNVRWGPDPIVVDPNPAYPNGCDAIYGPGTDVKLTFNVGAALRAISGIQGRLVLDAPGGLAITDLVAFPPGWQVARTTQPGGSVRFIAFAGPGAEPIPATRSGTPYPVFTVTVHANDGELPIRARLVALDLLVSDAGGNGIPACPRITLDVMDDPNVAILCRAPSTCDANHDGQTDVRDLVAMVNCLNPPPNVRLDCSDSTGAVFDCDGDHDFDLADVFCCARRMLGGTPGGEGDSLRRDAPEIALRFDVPTAGTDGTLDVPLLFDGMAGVVAGRFDVTYPDARYEVVDVTIAGAPASWWTIHDVTPGRVSIAMLDLAGMPGAGTGMTAGGTDGATATIRLRLRDGAAAGGELAVAAHDFAAADGYVLVTPNAAPRVALGSVGRVALSAAQPNPFSVATSLALTLPDAGPADVAVFNAAGRRVATLLHTAHAAAGVYPLAWNGADDSGGRVAGGVYFVRVIGGAGNVSRKLLFLPGGAR